jgi:outer membrane protein insertion porin family
LPLAYTRFLATYRFERQKIIDEYQQGDVPAQITTGFRLNQETTLSSSLALALTRNSTNHPIYPTLGSKSLLRVEWSGGPLGGDQVFQKYEFDWARYLSTVKAGGWGPTLMLRTRAGAVGELFRDTPLIPTQYQVEESLEDAVWDTLSAVIGPGMTVPVPRHYLTYPAESYELFRMGGTTYDPLRGYDDFEIVPRDNVARQFFVSPAAVDSNGTVTDWRVSTLNSFYPGGRYMLAFTGELQFVIAEPLHGLIFADFGGTWNEVQDFRWDSFHKSVGIGARIEIPLLGLVGFDYAYGFDRLDRFTGRYDRKGWEPHLQFGRIF